MSSSKPWCSRQASSSDQSSTVSHVNIKFYSKICVKLPLSKRPKIGFKDQISLKAGQKYCRMLQGEQSAILSTFIKIFVLSIFEFLFYTGFTVITCYYCPGLQLTLTGCFTSGV